MNALLQAVVSVLTGLFGEWYQQWQARRDTRRAAVLEKDIERASQALEAARVARIARARARTDRGFRERVRDAARRARTGSD